MKTSHALNKTIATYMELFSKLGTELPDAIDGLSSLCIDTLLAGGKLIVLSDKHSSAAAMHLCNAMNLGSAMDRPALPSINFNQLTADSQSQAGDLLRGISKEKDLIIVMTEKLENISLDLLPEQTVVISADSQSHPTSPTLSLGLTERDQWLLSLTVIINILSNQIEQRLFG